MSRQNPHLDDSSSTLGPSLEARGWELGYDVGVSSPGDLPHGPLTRSTEFMDAWDEGAAAGQADGQAEGWRLRLDEHGAGLVPVETSSSPGPGEPRNGSFERSWRCTGSLPLRLMLAQVEPRAPASSGLDGSALASVCTDQGLARLYLPVCVSPLERADDQTGDPLRDAGYWHGSVADSVDEAGKAALAHGLVRTPHSSGLVRYVPADRHNFWDWLPV
ncbi:hypothetical protein AB1484_18725 [Parafrankia sp. FMc6]|uniref:hypothetical protein n=1 Tax=Parafrankia soli TaxID=2599596 RepID=UPI0034D426BB